MKNKETSLAQAYKLYTGTNIAKFIIKTTVYTFILSFFFNFVFNDNELNYFRLYYNGVATLALSSLYFFNTANVKLRGMFFRTVKDCIGMYQKYHLASLLSGIAVILVSFFLQIIIFGMPEETVIICLFTLFVRAVVNIIGIMEHDAARCLVLCFFAFHVFLGTIIGGAAVQDFNIKLELGLGHIILVLFTAAIFIGSEILVLKSIRNNWYKD